MICMNMWLFCSPPSLCSFSHLMCFVGDLNLCRKHLYSKCIRANNVPKDTLSLCTCAHTRTLVVFLIHLPLTDQTSVFEK